MNCREARKFLSAFVDDELDVRTNVELLEHIEMCSACAHRLERLRNLCAVVEAHIASVDAPETLKGRVRDSLAALEGARSHAPGLLGRLAQSGWFRVSAAAASILLVFGLVYVFLVVPPAAVNSQALLAHAAVMHDNVPAFVFTNDLDRARRLALFKMESMPETPLLKQGRFELVGAGPAEIELTDVGHFVLRYRGHAVSMFVFEGLDIDKVEGRRIETRLGETKVQTRGDLSLVAWRRDGFTYILVGRMQSSALVEMAESGRQEP